MNYQDIISIENLLGAWQEFVKGKRKKKDVSEFSLNLSENIYILHQDLVSFKYTHGPYKAFKINDPKPRDIHKAQVRDRLLHHAIYRVLYPYFDKKFIHDSYSCRDFKGTHKAMDKFNRFARKVSKNHTKTCWTLKCDIKKFFASVDHEILIEILNKHIKDQNTIWLLQNIIQSFYSTKKGKGLPLGNLTSQLLVNIYMNEFDQFVKHHLNIKHYTRYADDFVILYTIKTYSEDLISQISTFLQNNLKLSLHPNKVFIKTHTSGVDYLGWIHFKNHKILRTSTKKRMFKKLEQNNYQPNSVQSYLGLLGYGNCYILSIELKNGLKARYEMKNQDYYTD